MNIVILAIDRERAEFFCRTAKVWEEIHNVAFLVTRYHICRYIRNNNFKVNMIQDFIVEDTDVGEFVKFKDDAALMERKAELLTEKLINKQIEWLCKGFKGYFGQNSVDKLIIWNGSMFQGYVASIVAEYYKIEKLFLEIGNFPNKLFIDAKGVNAKSSLMNTNLSICEDYNEEKLMDFLEKHKQSKEDSHIVPQARKTKLNYSAIWDTLYNMFSKYPIVWSKYTILEKLLRRLIANRSSIEFDSVDPTKIEYILFPLQVSIDSQVLRNSGITIEDSINYALNAATKNNLALFIKPHPAEKNENIIAYIYKLKKKHKNLYLTNQNTYQLIKHSRKVITINSTVGIEGLMYYKHVEVLGRALYKPYCEPDLSKPVDIQKTNKFLYNYLFNCLIDADYFAKDNLHIEIPR